MTDRRDSGFLAMFVRHPNAANLLMIMLVLGGLFATMRLQTQFFPTVETDRITIAIPWPGASAEDVEANILEAVEAEVRFLNAVKEVTSYAREGQGTILLEYEPNSDMQQALSEAETAVAGITTLPQDSEEPRITRAGWYESVAKLAVSGPFSEVALKQFARRIRDDLLAAGIDKVTLSGVRSEEIWVEVSAADLRRLDLSLEQISARIAEGSRDLPAGTLGGKVERQLRSLSSAKTPEDFAAIDVRALPSGERIRIGDIATVSAQLNTDEPIGFNNGERAIEINVQRSASADTLNTSRILDEYLEKVAPSFPKSLKIIKYDERSEALKQRINLLVSNGVSGLALVVLTLFIFLNARIAIWVAAGIPIAIMATMLLMLATGQSINMISLFALILTLGIVVDDAIVVGEHTATVYAQGAEPTDAALRGVRRMLVPVTAATLTTQAAFLPMFLIRDVIGQILQALPLVVIVVLTASLIESFFVLPSHLRHSLTKVGRNKHRLISLDGVSGGPRTAFTLLLVCVGLLAALALFLANVVPAGVGTLMERTFLHAATGTPSGYLALLGILTAAALCFVLLIVLFEGLGVRARFDRAFAAFRDGPVHWLATMSFRWRYVTVATALSLLIVSFGVFAGGFVKFRLFPSPESESLNVVIVFGAGTPRDRATEALRTVEGVIYRVEQRLGGEKGALVTNIYTNLGRVGRAVDENVAEMDVQLTASEDRTVRTREILIALNRSMPRISGVDRVTIKGRTGGPPGRDVDVRISGAEPAVLKRAALEVRDILSRYPGVSGVSDDLPYGRQELILELTPRGTALGFTVQNVGTQVRNGFEGAIAKRFARGEDEITVRVKYDEEGSGLAGLRSLFLRSPDGQEVPLAEIVNIREKAGFSIIQHRQGIRTVSITGDVDSQVVTSLEVIDSLRSGVLDEVARKYGIKYAFSGREEERTKSFADLKLGLLIALCSIYLILAWVFASYFRPLAVMFIVPFGIVGAIFGHWSMGFHMSLLSFMGLLGLAGILVNDSIILVSRLDERLADGEDLEPAAVGAAKDRLRAVLLTSLTTIGGLLPLMFEKSLQAQFLLPMGATLVFGLGVATLLVLFLVPAVVGIGEDFHRLFLAFRAPRPAGHAAE